MKKISNKKQEFNEFRFGGLNAHQISNEYLTMDRVSEDETRIVVKIAASNIVETKYGYAVIINRTHVVFVKKWQVSDNWYGIEVILDKNYFVPKKWGERDDFEDDGGYLTFDAWLNIAKAQRDLTDDDGLPANPVRWRIRDNVEH